MKMNNHELGSVDFEKQIDEIFDVGANLQKFDNLRAEVCDDNGKPYRTEDGGYLPHSEFDLDGTHYETDDNGGIYKADGKYYPDDWFVLNGEFYQTDENGQLMRNDLFGNAESSFGRREPKTTSLPDGTGIESPDSPVLESPEPNEVYDEEKLIDLIAVNCPEGYLELNNELEDINSEKTADDPEVKPTYEVLEKDEFGTPVLVTAKFSDGETNYQYVFACGSETYENASGKLFKHLYENYGIGLGDIASVTDWDYRPEHAIITTSPNEERIFVVAHTINPNCPEDFKYACMDWVKQDDGSWKFGYEFPIQQEYGSDYDEQALLESVSDDLGWGLDFSDGQYELDGQDSNTSDVQEPSKKGGSYKDVRVEGEGDKYEVHHMPADSASPLERGDGPAIKMEKEDHRQTASCGMSREAREYREQQRELIEQGKFREALQMDIDDIHEKFGDKYDDAIAEMLEYVDQLEQEGKI